jgi:hypothetical protein
VKSLSQRVERGFDIAKAVSLFHASPAEAHDPIRLHSRIRARCRLLRAEKGGAGRGGTCSGGSHQAGG